MKCVKRSITLPETLDRFVNRLARRRAKLRGNEPNYSAVLADMIIEAKQAKPAGNGQRP